MIECTTQLATCAANSNSGSGSDEDVDDIEGCWVQSYGRGAGIITSECSGGKEYDAGLCYPKCEEGYSGVGPVCW